MSASIVLGNPSQDGRAKKLLRFEFPHPWVCLHFDEKSPTSPFANPDRARLEQWCIRASWRDPTTRRVTFAPAASGMKAVDIVAYDPTTKTLYLIEGTDYRVVDAPAIGTLPDEVAAKFRDTLAALAVGLVPAPRAFAPLTQALAEARDIVCVLHLELPDDPLLGPADTVNTLDQLRWIMRHAGLRTEVFSGQQQLGWRVEHLDTP